jgi:maltooligosyltrehalose trehalohydrolase
MSIEHEDTVTRRCHTLDPTRRRLPIGAEVLGDGGVYFRVWASHHHRVEVVIERGPEPRAGTAPQVVELTPEGQGYFSGFVASAGAGTLYRYRLESREELSPDPASRFQPRGPMVPPR